MRLQESKSPHKQFSAVLVPAPANIPGNLAIKRTDTKEIIALRDIVGVPNIPGSTVKYQILEVEPAEKASLAKEGLVIAATVEDYRNWYNQWDGLKPTKTFPF